MARPGSTSVDWARRLQGLKGLTVPGYTGSGPEHWQTLWEAAIPGLLRVDQRDWDHPEPRAWRAALVAAVHELEGPAVLIAHSLGCALVAHWALEGGRTEKILGALLVAPADVDRPGWPFDIGGFRPMPCEQLPIPSMVVASRNDDWVTLERAGAFAAAWGGGLLDAGPKGHLNSESGLGLWEEGLVILESCVRAWRKPAG